MSEPADRRQHLRLSLDWHYTVRYELEGRVFRGVEMTNLSLGGLGFKLGYVQAATLRQGTILRGIVLEHPSLPQVKVDGEVRHLLGLHVTNTDGFVLVGVQFLQPTEGFLRQIEAFIQRRLGEGG